jgi:hypothetical protein
VLDSFKRLKNLLESTLLSSPEQTEEERIQFQAQEYLVALRSIISGSFEGPIIGTILRVQEFFEPSIKCKSSHPKLQAVFRAETDQVKKIPPQLKSDFLQLKPQLELIINLRCLFGELRTLSRGERNQELRIIRKNHKRFKVPEFLVLKNSIKILLRAASKAGINISNFELELEDFKNRMAVVNELREKINKLHRLQKKKSHKNTIGEETFDDLEKRLEEIKKQGVFISHFRTKLDTLRRKHQTLLS